MNFNTTELTLDQLLPIFDGITDAVFIDDANGICQWCNDACEDIYGIEMDEKELYLQSDRWEMSHGGLSGRCAGQFINHLLSEK